MVVVPASVLGVRPARGRGGGVLSRRDPNLENAGEGVCAILVPMLRSQSLCGKEIQFLCVSVVTQLFRF